MKYVSIYRKINVYSIVDKMNDNDSKNACHLWTDFHEYLELFADIKSFRINFQARYNFQMIDKSLYVCDGWKNDSLLI